MTSALTTIPYKCGDRATLLQKKFTNKFLKFLKYSQSLTEIDSQGLQAKKIRNFSTLIMLDLTAIAKNLM